MAPMPRFLLLSFGVQRAHSQLCPLQDLDQFDEIARICCESTTGSADCSGGFPPACTRECSMMLEPWWTACGPMVDLLGDLWAADEQEMGLFAEGPCHHTNVLFEHAAIGSCPPDLLAAWTDDVNAACCQQNGIFECEAGTPWTCDAECAVEFGPYWEHCMMSTGMQGGEDLAGFAALYETCKTLPPSEGRLLMREVNNLINDPWCSINTTSIISIDQANAPCAVDESGFCARTIESGLYTCGEDYCSTCPQSHACDHSCSLPCVGQVGGPALGVAAEPEIHVCETDSSRMCDRTISAGLYSCATDYCITCPQSHSCDNSCSFPCGTTDGGKRRVQEYWVPSPETDDSLFDISVVNQIACPLDSFMERAHEVEAQCCHSNLCPRGLPEDCTFDCGRFFTSFMVDCNSTIHGIFPDRTVSEYVAFGEECSRMDPMSMVRAIDETVCSTCGDNITQAPLEECDWGVGMTGGGNSYAPNSCRPDCLLPYCGDGVVDFLTEGCDNADQNGPDADCDGNCQPTCSQQIRSEVISCGRDQGANMVAPSGISYRHAHSSNCENQWNDDVQAVLLDREAKDNLGGLREYIRNGGIVITEFYGGPEVLSAVFGDTPGNGGTDCGGNCGTCEDHFPNGQPTDIDDPFWQELRGQWTEDDAHGCARYNVAQFPGTTLLVGDRTESQFGYRDFGSGRVWFMGSDWGDSANHGTFLPAAVSFMITHRSCAVPAPPPEFRERDCNVLGWRKADCERNDWVYSVDRDYDTPAEASAAGKLITEEMDSCIIQGYRASGWVSSQAFAFDNTFCSSDMQHIYPDNRNPINCGGHNGEFHLMVLNDDDCYPVVDRNGKHEGAVGGAAGTGLTPTGSASGIDFYSLGPLSLSHDAASMRRMEDVCIEAGLVSVGGSNCQADNHRCIDVANASPSTFGSLDRACTRRYDGESPYCTNTNTADGGSYHVICTCLDGGDCQATVPGTGTTASDGNGGTYTAPDPTGANLRANAMAACEEHYGVGQCGGACGTCNDKIITGHPNVCDDSGQYSAASCPNMGTCYDWRLQDGCGFGKARVSDDGVNWRAP